MTKQQTSDQHPHRAENADSMRADHWVGVRVAMRDCLSTGTIQTDESHFTAIVAAILEQRANPSAASRALENLREEGVLEINRMIDAPLDELAEWIAPAGDAKRKANRLRKVCRLLSERFFGSAERLLTCEFNTARAVLASINGIGVETADWILLRASGAVTYPVSRAAFRVLARHGLTAFDADYESIREKAITGLNHDPAALLEFSRHAEIVARDYCRTIPECEGCPLQSLLPAGGPLQPDP